MSRKVAIINVTVNESVYEVTYSTGTIRKYPINKAPSTVTTWLANQADNKVETILEEAKTSPREKDEEILDRLIEILPNPNPDQEVLRENLRKDLWRGRDYWETPAPEPKAEVKVEVEPEKELPVVSHKAEVLPDTAPKKTSIFWTVVNVLTDIYYWATTYIPIGARWLFIHLIWLIQDNMPKVKRVVSVARNVITTTVITTVKVACVAIIIWKEGWRFRKELINEWN